jgi:hypothetical protein
MPFVPQTVGVRSAEAVHLPLQVHAEPIVIEIAERLMP